MTFDSEVDEDDDNYATEDKNYGVERHSGHS